MKEKISVILLGHKSQAGKDTVGEFLQETGFVRAAFADKLKETVADLYNFTYEQMHGSLKDVEDQRYPNDYDPTHFYLTDSGEQIGFRYYGEEDNLEGNFIPNTDYRPYLTPRRMLQIFGQQQRALFPDIWAAYVFNTTIPLLVEKGHRNIVITDFRFRNEGAYARKWEAEDPDNRKLLLCKIHRPGVSAESGAGDISEKDLDGYEFDRVIVNDGSLSELREWAIKLALEF